MSVRTSDTRAATRYLVIGGLCGLAWAAGLRGWMAELAAGGSESKVTWMTLVLLLLPGTIIGALLGWSAYLRSKGVRGSRSSATPSTSADPSRTASAAARSAYR